jgi:ribosome-associated protein
MIIIADILINREEKMEKNSIEMVKLAIEGLEDKKAEDIRIIDISEVSVIADYFIIAGGSNRSQIQALSDSVCEKLGRSGHPEKQIEGYDTANWVLIDFGDIIVHIFDKENRLLYDLERLWRDGKTVEIDELK